MNNMTIDDLKDRKLSAEEAISKALRGQLEAFEQDTGLVVESVDTFMRRGFEMGFEKPTLLTINTSITFKL